MRALGLKPADVAAMQRGFALQYGEPGSGGRSSCCKSSAPAWPRTRCSAATARGGSGSPAAEAQKEIDTLIGDREFGKKLEAKQPEAVARWDRLNAAVAAERDRKARVDAGG
jgi:hypothetical protein